MPNELAPVKRWFSVAAPMTTSETAPLSPVDILAIASLTDLKTMQKYQDYGMGILLSDYARAFSRATSLLKIF